MQWLTPCAKVPAMRLIINLKSTILLTSLGAVAMLAAAGCGAESEPAPGGDRAASTTGDAAAPVDVVATTMQLQDFTREVGGDRVRVSGILGPDSEPHEYEPTPSDADAVSGARVVVANGANLDDWLDDLLEQAGAGATRVDAVKGISLLPTEEEAFPGDPHVWHDPDLAKRMVDNVAAGLEQADPAGRETYRRNAGAYKGQLDRMAATIRREFADIPPDRRDLVTSHDAFGYFARAYDVNVLGSVLPAVTTEAEPSARQIRELVGQIRANGVKAIFTEEAVEPRLEQRVAEEAGARVSTSLYADALGEIRSDGATFVDSEIANARTMRSAWEAR